MLVEMFKTGFDICDHYGVILKKQQNKKNQQNLLHLTLEWG